jgi:small GTP-binding protein
MPNPKTPSPLLMGGFSGPTSYPIRKFFSTEAPSPNPGLFDRPALNKHRNYSVCIIGTPNVGKSTLFNFLVQEHRALNMKIPGLTRDRKYGQMDQFGYPIRVIDTAGFEFDEITDKDLQKKMFEQTKIAIANSDLVLFLIDARRGINLSDMDLAKWLRKSVLERYPSTPQYQTLKDQISTNQDPTLTTAITRSLAAEELMLVDRIQLVANKCELPFNPELENEIYGLDLGEPIYISGEHGDNIHDLFGVINNSVTQDYKVTNNIF